MRFNCYRRWFMVFTFLCLAITAYAEEARRMAIGCYDVVASPAGRYVAVSSTRDEQSDKGTWLYDIKTEQWSLLTAHYGEIRWLPDGQSMIMAERPKPAWYADHIFYQVDLKGHIRELGRVSSVSYDGWQVLPDGSGLVAVESVIKDKDRNVECVIAHQYVFSTDSWQTLARIIPPTVCDSTPVLVVRMTTSGWQFLCFGERGDHSTWLYHADIEKNEVIQSAMQKNPRTVPRAFAASGTWGADEVESGITAFGATGNRPNTEGAMIGNPFGVAYDHWPNWSPNSSMVAISGPLLPVRASWREYESDLAKMRGQSPHPLKSYHILDANGQEITSGEGRVAGWIGNDLLLIRCDNIPIHGRDIAYYYLQPLSGGPRKPLLIIPSIAVS